MDGGRVVLGSLDLYYSGLAVDTIELISAETRDGKTSSLNGVRKGGETDSNILGMDIPSRRGLEMKPALRSISRRQEGSTWPPCMRLGVIEQWERAMCGSQIIEFPR